MSEFHAFGVGCCVYGGVYFLQGFVVWSLVRDGSDGCGVFGATVRMDCWWLCAGWHRLRVSRRGQLHDDVFNVGIKLSGQGVSQVKSRLCVCH